MAETPWVKLVDPSSGNDFFANIDTGICVWELPTHLPVRPKSQAAVDGDEWWELCDETSQLPYYFNFATKVTEWGRPTHGAVLPLMRVKLSEIARTIDENGNAVPDDDEEDEEYAEQQQQQPLTAADLPDGWDVQYDDSTGLNFFINLFTSKSQWERPTVPAVDPSASPSKSPVKQVSRVDSTGVKETMLVEESTVSGPPDLGELSDGDNNDTTTDPIDDYLQRMTSASRTQQHQQQAEQAEPQQRKQAKSPPTKLAKPKLANTTTTTTTLSNGGSALPSPTSSSNSLATQSVTSLSTSNNNSSHPSRIANSRENSIDATDIPPAPAPPHFYEMATTDPRKMQTRSIVGMPRQPVVDLRDTRIDSTHGDMSTPQLNIDAAWSMSPLNPANAGQHGVKTNSDLVKEATVNHARLHGALETLPDHIPALPSSLKDAIANFQMEGYAKKYFAVHKKGLFRRKIPLESMMVWQAEPIPGALLGLRGKASYTAKDAVSIFKTIQACMADRQAKVRQSPSRLTQVVLEKALFCPEIRDEVYVQLIKQLTKNPTEDSVRRGWTLMAVLVSVFPPSRNFEGYLFSFFAEHHNDEHRDVMTVSRFSSKKLDKICAHGAGARVPSIAEIDRLRDLPYNPSVFGSTLEDIMERPEEHGLLPRVLTTLVEAVLNAGGEKTEGIFRVPGDTEGVSALKLVIEKGDYDECQVDDPHQAASLLKLWLRELEEPLIPASLYDECIKIGAGLGAVEMLERLPELNRRVAEYLIAFLQRVGRVENRKMTLMSIDNLAMVFAPSFLRCPSDNPAVLFENTRFEQDFTRNLLTSVPFVDLRTIASGRQ